RLQLGTTVELVDGEVLALPDLAVPLRGHLLQDGERPVDVTAAVDRGQGRAELLPAGAAGVEQRVDRLRLRAAVGASAGGSTTGGTPGGGGRMPGRGRACR